MVQIAVQMSFWNDFFSLSTLWNIIDISKLIFLTAHGFSDRITFTFDIKRPLFLKSYCPPQKSVLQFSQKVLLFYQK